MCWYQSSGSVVLFLMSPDVFTEAEPSSGSQDQTCLSPVLKGLGRCEPLAVQPTPTSPIHLSSTTDIGTVLQITRVLKNRYGIEYKI